MMTMSKTEINLRRLLASSGQQLNQAKLMHYVATLREQLEHLAEEKTSAGLPRVSKGTLGEYSEKIEVIANKLSAAESNSEDNEELSVAASVNQTPTEAEESSPRTGGLRRRIVSQSTSEGRSHDGTESDQSTPVKLDAVAQSHIHKHRKLQEDLTDEMVGLARQLKESSLLMSQSISSTGKLLDSTEKAVEHSLASTGHATTRAAEIYSLSSKTTCFQWLLIFVMTMVFIMVVLLIRIT